MVTILQVTCILFNLNLRGYIYRKSLVLVNNIEDLEKIWTWLKDAFGDARLLLKIKFKTIEKTSPIWKLKDKHSASFN